MEAHLFTVCAEWLDQLCCSNVNSPLNFSNAAQSAQTMLILDIQKPVKLNFLLSAAGCASTVCVCGAHSQQEPTSLVCVLNGWTKCACWHALQVVPT